MTDDPFDIDKRIREQLDAAQREAERRRAVELVRDGMEGVGLLPRTPQPSQLDGLEGDLKEIHRLVTQLDSALTGRLLALEERVQQQARQLQRLQERMEMALRRWEVRFPPTWNCPHCGRRTSPDATVCSICSRPMTPVQG